MTGAGSGMGGEEASGAGAEAGATAGATAGAGVEKESTHRKTGGDKGREGLI